jgi:enhancer of mRNA-decapping protein 4
VVDVRAELGSLLQAGRYDEAFSRALGLQDTATVGWLCTQQPPGAVLGLEPPPLSQLVVLSLIQQLSADLLSGEVASKLSWVREAALALAPGDPAVAAHARPVLAQAHASLGAAAGVLRGADASACKLAMHVVHSQMTS